MSEITLTINGQKVIARKGETLLEAAKSKGIDIPSLCHMKELTPYGGCRLCLVEITRTGRSQLVASCGYFVREGLVVETDSPRVHRVRKLLLELLLASMPDSPDIQRWADRYEVRETRFKRPLEHCILCGLCVRYCEEIKKKTAWGSWDAACTGKSPGRL